METKYFVGLVIVCLALIVFIFSGENFGGGVQQERPMVDCGNDTGCFEENALNCTKAKVQMVSETATWLSEIRGQKEGKCEAYFQVIEVNTDSEYLSVFPEELAQEAAAWKGKSMACMIPMNGTEYDPMNITQYCSGELKDAIEETGKKFNEHIMRLRLTSRACIPQLVWSHPESRYEILGLEKYNEVDVCHINYKLEVPGVTGTIVADHYFNIQAEELSVSYDQAPKPPSENFSVWCLTAPRWSYKDESGTSKVFSAEPIDMNGTVVCKIDIIAEAGHPELPGITATVYIAPDATTVLSIQTSAGNVVRKAYTAV